MQVSATGGTRIDFRDLWHDIDVDRQQRSRTSDVVVYDIIPLPREEHQLPPWVIAADQEERGMRGFVMLHGRAPPVPKDIPDPRTHADVTQAINYSPAKGSLAAQAAEHSVRLELQQIQQTAQAAQQNLPAPKSASKTASQKEAQAAAPAAGAGDGIAAALATFLPMAAGQAAAVAGGPLAAMASQGVIVASAVASATELAAVGISEGLKEDEPVVVKRGLGRKKDRVERS